MNRQLGTKIGPYRLVRLLGSGGMGEVYEAVHERIARQVAIKILHPDLARDKETASRFLNEARAVNIVRHPGLIQISDHGQLTDGTTYIVMEFLSGETLADYLKRQGGRLPEIQVLYLGRQIAKALAAAHAKRIVHRDLKPANVMLVLDAGGSGNIRIKLLDFGIAKVERENQVSGDFVKTKAGVVLGSPLYMSPEQCQGAELVQSPSDVYSFGVMLYHLLSGEPPFVAESTAGVLGKHLFAPPPPLQSKCPQVSQSVAALVDSMLRKTPQDRPTMAAVASQLQHALRQQQPEPGNWIGLRRRLIVGVSATLVGLAAVAVAFSSSSTIGNRLGGIRRCSAAGFCREPLPEEVTRLRSLFAFSASDVWACGDPGVLLHFDGQQWKLVHHGYGHRLHQIFGFGPRDLWVVGDHGTLLHFDGNKWSQIKSERTAYLTGIWGAHPADLWVVGKVSDGQATLLHFDGKAWTQQANGTTQPLLSIWGVRSDLIWAAGHQGTILKYDGTEWRQVAATGT
jgi:serine/threonine protein kinase